MLEKGAIKKILQHKHQHAQNQFLSNLFLVRKKDGGLPCGYKSENSESVCILYALQNGKFADFKIYDEGKRLHVRNRFERRLFYSASRQIMLSISTNSCVCVFVKILKVPIFLLHRLNIRIFNYQDGILLISQSIERILVTRYTVIFLLQHLGFAVNLKISVMEPVQAIEYLGLVINSIRMTLSLTEEKVKGISQKCKIIFSVKETTVLQLTQLVGLLSSTIQAVLPAQI